MVGYNILSDNSGVRSIFQWGGGGSKVTSKIYLQSILWQINNFSAVSQNEIKVTQVMQIKVFKQKTIKH